MVNQSNAEPKPFAAFDVDGTICQSSLLEALVKGCIEDGVFSADAFAPADEIKRAWKSNNKEGTYNAYLDMLVSLFVRSIQGKSVDRIHKVSQQVVAQQQVRRYAFPRWLMSQLRHSHTMVAISGSPLFIVQPYVADMGFDYVYGSMYAQQDGLFTTDIKPVGAKAKILAELIANGLVIEQGSVAVGDTMTDKDMLRLADAGIMFNTSQTLMDYGRQFSLPIALEHKDRITLLAHDRQINRYRESTLDEILASVTS